MKTFNTPEYIEISFQMPFYDLYFEDENWDESKVEKQPNELIEICKLLDIQIDTNFLYDEYNKNLYTGGDIHVFHSIKYAGTFIYFDLIRDKTDQMAMVFIGFRFLLKAIAPIKEKILSLYFKACVHTDLTEDYFQNKLFNITKGNATDLKRTIHHYNYKSI